MRLRAEQSCVFGGGGGALWPRHERGLSLIRRQAGHRASAMGNLPSETKAASPSRTSASHERLLCVCDGPTEAYGIRVNNIGTIRGICSFPSLFFPLLFSSRRFLDLRQPSTICIPKGQSSLPILDVSESACWILALCSVLFLGFFKCILLYLFEGCIVVGTVVAARLMAYRRRAAVFTYNSNFSQR